MEDIHPSRVGSAPHADNESMLHARIRDLEGELQLALGAAEDIRLLKSKLMNVVDRNRIEKERTLKIESDAAFTKKRMDMLADHLEKLMTHLKHEAATKVKLQEKIRVLERELVDVKENASILQRKSAAKDRLVLELREGSKILEDQLRLMDDKFLELRSKLDWARENGEKRIRKANAVAKQLRVKFALMGNNAPLDKIQLPSIDSGSVDDVSYTQSNTNDIGSFSYADDQSDRRRNSSGKTFDASLTSSSSSRKSTDTATKVSKTPSMNNVMEKIRKHQGAQLEWTDEKLKNLTKSR